MTEPFVFEPTVMKSVGDCGICCLRMLLGVPYEAVLAALSKKAQRTVMQDGANVLVFCNAAKRLGFTLEYHDDDFNPDYVGVLVLERTVNDDKHMVMWSAGTIYNPADGLIYTDLETYLTKTLYKVVGFLFRRG